LGKRRIIEKVIIAAIQLAGAGRTRGAGYGASHVRMPGQNVLAQGRLAAARRRGNNDQ
jgi:hypothetical protein